MTRTHRLFRVLAAFHIFRTPARVRDALQNQISLDETIAQHDHELSGVETEATRLAAEGVRVVAVDDHAFPPGLFHRGRPIAPALFYKGNIDLLASQCVGVSGSRDVSERGGSAAARSGAAISDLGFCLVAGNARGVDTIAVTSALTRSGRAILVLPEGISRFEPRAELHSLLTDGNHLIVSQFTPGQRWATHNAMARNRVICGLSRSVVVIEARESGGSLAAGREALKTGRQLLALTYGDRTPSGNRLLVDEGAVPVDSPDMLKHLLSTRSQPPEQGSLF